MNADPFDMADMADVADTRQIEGDARAGSAPQAPPDPKTTITIGQPGPKRYVRWASQQSVNDLTEAYNATVDATETRLANLVAAHNKLVLDLRERWAEVEALAAIVDRLAEASDLALPRLTPEDRARFEAVFRR